ncbi:UDP-N-acetylmuramate dehydrogenase [Microbacterium halimionae]|uniref:UDP-N-acetylenolpyruvoylglucosamine reductase n=1 Tax=Microbacterium halimionae TaxID=1526413 RepID=A0A7W3JM77_9MICO|nr:UDP-N-acetylmuramate dehydrogenase [Microbacterium halimionae]MBA8815378.1 UDP-N-acetylmuramate dehydrogenase [Microbacterium halimionae]NII95425.1 UDP-N-acetylmuramate dehydrogenase [Microbacterium halimionae]
MPEIEPIPLAQLTTLHTGGTPARMIDAHTRDELVSALRDVWETGESWFVVGGGSNLFVGDDDFDGTVIRVLTSGIEELPSERENRVRLKVEAGHGWDAFVATTVERGLAGVEALSGIPGTVGAAPVQNIGAYGQEIVQTLVEVDLIDEATGEIETVAAADLALGFRTSVLKNHYGSVPQRPAVVLSATFDLVAVGKGEARVSGEQLRGALGIEPEASVTLQWVREQVLSTRSRKGMVLDADDPDTYSAGSFFQNAIVSESFARSLPEACPRWPMTTDLDAVTVIPLDRFNGVVQPPAPRQALVKVSSAWLIENSGFAKGFKLPRSRAGLSTKHALALTNRGDASAAELAELARYIVGRVQSEYGLILQPEPVLVGVEL